MAAEDLLLLLLLLSIGLRGIRGHEYRVYSKKKSV